jgi:hypothetical protein
MLALAYLARYAPGSPTPWLMHQTRAWVMEFRDRVGDIVAMEQGKPAPGGDEDV